VARPRGRCPQVDSPGGGGYASRPYGPESATTGSPLGERRQKRAGRGHGRPQPQRGAPRPPRRARSVGAPPFPPSPPVEGRAASTRAQGGRRVGCSPRNRTAPRDRARRGDETTMPPCGPSAAQWAPPTSRWTPAPVVCCAVPPPPARQIRPTAVSVQDPGSHRTAGNRRIERCRRRLAGLSWSRGLRRGHGHELQRPWLSDQWPRRLAVGATTSDPPVTQSRRNQLRRPPPSNGEQARPAERVDQSPSFSGVPASPRTAMARRAEPLPRSPQWLRSWPERRLRVGQRSGRSRHEQATIPASHPGGDQPVGTHRTVPPQPPPTPATAPSPTWAPRSSRRRPGEERGPPGPPSQPCVPPRFPSTGEPGQVGPTAASAGVRGSHRTPGGRRPPGPHPTAGGRRAPGPPSPPPRGAPGGEPSPTPGCLGSATVSAWLPRSDWRGGRRRGPPLSGRPLGLGRSARSPGPGRRAM